MDFKEEGFLVDLKARSKEHSKEESREELHLNTEFIDTLGHHYSVEIWPKGNFSFSSDSGFFGAANKVLMKGDMNRRTTGNTVTNLQKTNKKWQAREAQESEKLNAKNTKKAIQNSPSWNLTVVLLLGIGVAVYYFKGRSKS